MLHFFMAQGPLGGIVLFDMSSLKAATAAIFLASAGVGNAATVDVTVDGKEWRVGTVVGTFLELRSSLEAQVWWDNPQLADNFAKAVGGGLTTADSGPIFAYDSFVFGDSAPTGQRGIEFVFGFFFFCIEGLPCSSSVSQSFPDAQLTYAVADEINVIPLPAGLPLLLAGIGGLAALRIRKSRVRRT